MSNGHLMDAVMGVCMTEYSFEVNGLDSSKKDKIQSELESQDFVASARFEGTVVIVEDNFDDFSVADVRDIERVIEEQGYPVTREFEWV